MRLIVPLLLLIFISCSPEKENHELEKDNNATFQQDEFILRHSALGDTIETGVPQPPIGEGNYNVLSEMYFTNLPTAEFETLPINNNKTSLELVRTEALDTTLFTQNIPRDTNLSECQPPEKFDILPLPIVVQNPKRSNLAPWMYKDEVQFDIQILGTNQGLPSNTVNCFYKDVNGLFWIGTDKGLVSSDGVFIKKYDKALGLPESEIHSLAGDSKGNLFVGLASKGVLIYDGNEFRHLNLDSIRPNQPVNHISVNAKDEVWLSLRYGGIIELVDDGLKLFGNDQGFYTHRPLTSISHSSNGEIWVTGFGHGLYRIKNEKVEKVKQTTGYLNDGFLDSQGRFWAGSWTGDFICIKNDTIREYNLGPSYFDAIVGTFSEDNSGNIWLASGQYGIFHIDENYAWNYNKKDGISWEEINATYIDELDNIWIGTDGGGISKMNLRSFNNLNSGNGFKTDFINNVYDNDSEKLVYATNKGIFVEQDSVYKHYLSFTNPTGGFYQLDLPMQDVLVQDNAIWAIGRNYGLHKFTEDGGATRIGPGAGAYTNPSAMTIDKDGTIWVGYHGMENFVRVRHDSLWIYRGLRGVGFKNVTDMHVDHENNLWIASKSQGIAVSNQQEIIYYSTNEGLLSNSISGIYTDNNNRIWISSDLGLNYYENDKFYSVDPVNKYLSASINTLVVDQKNRYWIAGENGVIVLVPKQDEKEVWDLNDYNMIILDNNGGTPINEFISGSGHVDSQGNVYLGSKRGLLKWDPEKMLEKHKEPMVHVENIFINGTSVLDIQETSDEVKFNDEQKNIYNVPNGLELSPNHNNIIFNYSGIYWNAPKRLSYSYYLEGFETTWNKGGAEQNAEYTNLDYGNYKFHTKAELVGSDKSSEVIYEFTIHRPWYHTYWARFLFTILGILLLYLIIRQRTTQLKKRQTELESEIKNATSEISKSKDQIEQAHNEIKDSIAYAKRIQSAILPPQKLIKEYIPESFVYYLPKDIVAGDFHWMEPIKEGVLFAAADCTGHGVPGAMVSVICNNGLNRSVREKGLTDPGKILDATREIVISEFEKSEEDVKDGMDIALCLLSGNELTFAGANNPLWIIRNGSKEVEVVKADKQPIGLFEFAKPFVTHKIQLNPGDSFYVFSDGFADQFGGEKEKKFKSNNFKRLLLSMQNQSMQQQRLTISEAFENWKGSMEQVDDVCVIGVKV
jgi:serine phosphatase RsbU (regulator of sigma subunit)/ligand-binding sensor domain-containing protein